MRMREAHKGLGFLYKEPGIPVVKLCMRHLDGCVALQVDMLAQIHMSVTVTVHRGSHNYDVHLTLRQENGTWEIISADGM